ncbi:hypothetical protein SAMN04488109_6400 [Chryseolinea serpens]|uniref:Uncharacterized protein n=1 Tax=Chryseolinea serpens TaxID=947013 RepID=A0A1M5XCR5_9BACT|nr:hypothetical protein SAMN04488109_6400 [Chryseolinea serpens]
MNEPLRGLAKLGLVIFFCFTGLLITLYIWALSNKIAHPGYKNLSYEGYTWVGLVMLTFAAADFFILRRFIRSLKKRGQ